MQDPHTGEQPDARSVYLRTMRRLWVVPVSGAALALVFFLIYTAVIVTVRGQRQYETEATYELTFAYNENTQTAYDYYNAATWQGLLFTHPGITETIEAELPEGMTMEEAKKLLNTVVEKDGKFYKCVRIEDLPQNMKLKPK